MVPEPFAGMVEFDQWICWKTEPIPGSGKVTKIPVDPATGHPINSQDPAQHMTYRAAVTAAARLGFGVGFVFTKRDPFFFVDVDNAWDGTRWSETALNVFAALPGAAFEISQSGTGFHLFGKYDVVPDHSSRRGDLGLEFYTDGRFCAMTFREPRGCSKINLTESVARFASSVFPPKTAQAGAEWTTEPDPEWRGPEDDEELLRRILASRPSMAALTGAKATVVQLWNADLDALGRAYPDETDAGRPYDASSADAALLSALAFWTGKDAERMDRLFRLSGLMRDKWEAREDYRHRSIGFAVGNCDNVYKARAEGDPEAPTVDGLELATSYQYLAPDKQLDHFKGCVYIGDRHQILTPEGLFLSPPVFKAVYGGFVFAMDGENKDTSKNAFEVFTESRAVRFKKVNGTAFRPEDPPGTFYTEDGLDLVNSYVPALTACMPGNVSPFLQLLEIMLPDSRDREIFLCYMAAVIQYPGVKFQWCPVLQGCEGNGKSFFARALAMCVGRRYYHFPNAQDLDNKFNGWLEGKLFIAIEEIYQPGNTDIIEALKPMITNSVLEIQRKGGDQITGDNRANFMLFSNHKDAIQKTRTDRRYCVFYTAQQSIEDIEAAGMGGDYFPSLYRWLDSGGAGHIHHFLKNYQIREEFNPATSCHRAPATTSTEEAILLSRPKAEQLILEAIESGQMGFRGPWVSTFWLNHLFERVYGIDRKSRKEALDELGYIPHPGLNGGRASCSVPGENKPVIYIRAGSPGVELKGAAVQAAYLKAQELDTASTMGVASRGA